ncbi:twitching motility protein PilT [Candidatus Altiarchaeales archaeon WOR_SM1_SCG]|nr:twitching motility protein PilT [Candidatus Altiarchaeales archaeon WOR_SM1_SCG]
MKQVLVDTDILSLFFKEHPGVVARFKEYLKEYETLNFSIITYYEIVSGLKYRDARKQIGSFLKFAGYNSILPLTTQSVTISADIYNNLRKQGELIDDIDILIAGIALANDLVLVTGNEKHFKRIEGLKLQNWSY